MKGWYEGLGTACWSLEGTVTRWHTSLLAASPGGQRRLCAPIKAVDESQTPRTTNPCAETKDTEHVRHIRKQIGQRELTGSSEQQVFQEP